jgi:hypothetical protein
VGSVDTGGRELSDRLRAYAVQLPVVLSVPNLREALNEAADALAAGVGVSPDTEKASGSAASGAPDGEDSRVES